MLLTTAAVIVKDDGCFVLLQHQKIAVILFLIYL